jgi:hypothetical protein
MPPLKAIITGVPVAELSSFRGPAWVESERWNIMATAPGKADPAMPTEYEKMSEAQRKSTMELVRCACNRYWQSGSNSGCG